MTKLRTATLVVSYSLLAFLFPVLLFTSAVAADSRPILLWPNGAPGSQGQLSEEAVRINENGERIVSNVHRPSITPYLPRKDKATRAAVIIAPGGGHRELWMDHEGFNVAKFLSEHGVAAFVLKYRLARQENSLYTIEGDELADMQRAIRMVRSRAREWGINPEEIGVMGFSAGGELAALAATRYKAGDPKAADSIDHESAKPAFQALLYPAIPHDMKISKETPPAFLACGENDRADIAEGLPELYLALKRAGISAELHIYAGVGHGFGVQQSNRAPVSLWPELFLQWLAEQKLTAAENPAVDSARKTQ